MLIEPGQVAVITGGASGIGYGMAHRLAERGVHTVLADVRAGAVAQAAASIEALGAASLGVACDVARIEDVHALRERALDRFGRVDLVHNNAGVFTGLAPMWDIDLDVWRWNIDVMLWGVVHGHLAFVPHLVRQGRGHVVNTASLAGLGAVPFNAPYNAAKHAVVALSETLRHELDRCAPEVGVTVVCPGAVVTSLFETTSHNRPEWVRPESISASLDLWPVAGDEESYEPLAFADGIIAAVEANQLHCVQDRQTRRHARARIERLLDDLDA